MHSEQNCVHVNLHYIELVSIQSAYIPDPLKGKAVNSRMLGRNTWQIWHGTAGKRALDSVPSDEEEEARKTWLVQMAPVPGITNIYSYSAQEKFL